MTAWLCLLSNFKGLNNFSTLATPVNLTTTPSAADFTELWKPRMREVNICDVCAALGPIHMVSGTRDIPPYRGNFIERLYEKKLTQLLAESKLTLLNYL